MLDDKIIHDLRNPLSGITATVGLFLDGMLGDLTDEQKKYLQDVMASAKKIANILTQMQNLNHNEKRG